jgi:hypothetical protein
MSTNEKRRKRKMIRHTLIGIPLDEVGDKLKALDKSLRENGMALKADTGVHIDCNRDETAIGFVLEVVLLGKEEKENG